MKFAALGLAEVVPALRVKDDPTEAGHPSSIPIFISIHHSLPTPPPSLDAVSKAAPLTTNI